MPAGPAVWAGALRFPRRRLTTPASVDPQFLSFLEIYSHADRWGDIARWELDIATFGDGQPCQAGRTEYPAFPYGQLAPNADISADRYGTVHMSIGTGVRREHDERSWSAGHN